MAYNQIINYPRTTIIASPDYDLGLDLKQPAPGILMPFVHLDVHYWSPALLKHFKRHWPQTRQKLPPIVYAQGVVTDAKWRRFVTMFGFRKLIDCPCTDGLNREIFIHEALDGFAAYNHQPIVGY